MRVHSLYRTVILQAYPTREQERLLKRAEEGVLRFLQVSRRELEKMLYHKLKDEGLSPRTVSLLAQRFTGSLGEKAVIHFDGGNAKFVNENGVWYVEAQLSRGRNKREKILIAKSDNEYYDVIEHLSKFPFQMVRENDKWFIYVSIPTKVQSNGTVVGIDFNLRRWVAAPYEGRPIFFDASEYSEKVDELQRKIGRAYSKKDYEKAREYYRRIQEIVKLSHGNFLKEIRERYGICTLAMIDIGLMYKQAEKGDKLFNNWLYKKVAMRKFALRAMAKGFDVVEVSPKGIAKACFRCGSEVELYGRGLKLVKCDKCGLRDYNRDLNAARNIAKRGMETKKR